MPSNLFSILGTIGGVAGQAIANHQNAQQNALNRQHELYMLGQQQNWAAQQAAISDMRQRALYSDLQSPDAIKKQLEKAGLSIGLMYGQGGMGGQISSGAQADSPAAQNRGTIPMQNVFDAQTAAILADARLKEAQTEKTESETENNKADLPLKQQTIDYMQQQIKESEKNIEKTTQEIANLVEEQKNIIADTALKEANGDLTKAKTITEEKTQKLIEAQEQYQQALKKLSDIDAETRSAMNWGQINQIRAATEQYHAAAANLREQTRGLEKQNDILERSERYLIAQNLWTAIKTRYEAQQGKYTFEKLSPAELAKKQAEMQNLLEEAYKKRDRRYLYHGLDELFPGLGNLLRVTTEELMPF